MEYLLKTTKTINFTLTDDNPLPSYINISSGSDYQLDLSFLDNELRKFDLVISAKIKLAPVSFHESPNKISIFYFDDDNSKVYVDYGMLFNSYLCFDVTRFLFTKKQTFKSLYIENSSNTAIRFSAGPVSIFEASYYKQDQLFSNTNVVSDTLRDFQYSFNYVSQNFLAQKTILDKQLFFNFSLVYSNVNSFQNHLFLPYGWNFNVLEYLVFEDGEPVLYVGDDNRPQELALLEGLADYYYTNSGSALILKKEIQSGITTYKLYNEQSSSYKLFNANGNLVYYIDRNGNYFNVVYSSSNISITDSRGNEISIAKDSVSEFSVELNNNQVLIFEINTATNLLTSISDDDCEYFLQYLNTDLVRISSNSDYAWIFTKEGIITSKITKKYSNKTIDSKAFSYDYLQTIITKRTGASFYYQFDKNLNQIAFGEHESDYDSCLYAGFNNMLISESTGIISNIGAREYHTTPTSINSSSDSEEYQLLSPPTVSTNPFLVKNGHRYAVIATLEKNSDVVLNTSRSIQLKICDGQSPYAELCSLSFNPYLRKQTAINIFTAPVSEENYPFICKITAKGLYSFGGGVTLSKVYLVEINDEAGSTYWVNKISGDGVFVDGNSVYDTIDSLTWLKFDYKEFVPNNFPINTLAYSYRDLIRNYINVERDCNFYWSYDHRILFYNSSGGFPINNKINTISNNSVYAKKTIKKYVDVNGVDTPMYDFEYLVCQTETGTNIKKFYQYNLKCLGDNVYKTIKIYDINLNLIGEEDTQLQLRNETIYDSNNNVIKTQVRDLTLNSFLNEKEMTYDNKNRVASISSLVQQDFEEVEFDYLNNYELVAETTTPSGITTEFAYSNDLKHKTKVQINSLYNQATYSSGVVSTYSTNTLTSSFSVGEYGVNDTYSIANSLNQTSVLRLGHPFYGDMIGYLANSTNDKYVKSFNKYGNISHARYCHPNPLLPLDEHYVTETTFLYFETKPNNLSTITSQSTPTKSYFKLYKIIDSYSNRSTCLDYDNYDRIKEYLIYVQSNNSQIQLYKITYDYDDYDRLSSKFTYFGGINNVRETYTYQYPFAAHIDDITYNVSTSLLRLRNVIHEAVTRNNFNIIDAFEHYDNGTMLMKSHFKEQYTYNFIAEQVNGITTTHKNELISKVDFYLNGMISLNETGLVYDRSEYITYDSDGNIASIVHGNQISPTSNTGVAYEYDDYGRLVLETNYDYDTEISYSYDSNGNITSVSTSSINGTPISTSTYSYDNNYKDKLTSIADNEVNYDSDCNITSIGNDISYSWTRGRLLSSATNNNKTNSFVYNYDGIRTKKVDSNNVEHHYLLEGHKIVGEKLINNNITSYIVYLYGQNGIYGMIYNNNFYYFQKNILGDITHIYNKSTLVVRYIYDAFGNHKVVDSSGNIITDSSNVGHINPFRYRGYYYDEDIELYYCNARYYSPYLRRWISPDRYQYLDFENIGGLNLYAYCKNNPVMYRDEEGKK